MPETPPLTIRLGPARSERVEAHSEKTGLKLRAAVLDLVDRGLETAETAPLTPKVILAKAETAAGPLRFPRAPMGSRLKGASKSGKR